MRFIKQTFLMMLLSLFILSGCKKDDDGGAGGKEGVIEAMVDGKKFKSSSIPGVTYASSAAVGKGRVITVVGSTEGTTSKSITITLTGIGEPGTYQIGGKGNGSVIIGYLETEIDLANPTAPKITQWTAPWGDDTIAGELKISELTDEKISGTFNATCKNNDGTSTKELKSGSFNVKFIVAV